MTTPEGQAGIDALLHSFEEVGHLDSRGAFTLAAKRAAGKLARSLLGDPTDWILKVVQAACHGKADELRITQARKATHIAFSLPYALDIRALVMSLTQAQPAKQPGVEDLAMGLRAVAIAQDRSWVARLKIGDATHWILVSEGQVSIEMGAETSSETTTDLLIGVAFPVGQVGKVGGLVRFGAAIQNEHEALQARVRACPIPLFLDGKRLDDLARSDGLASMESEVFLGVDLGRSSDTLQPVSLPRGLQVSTVSRFRDRFLEPQPFFLPSFAEGNEGSSLLRVAFRFQQESRGSQARVPRLRSLTTSSRVLLLRHGVVVGRRSLGVTEAIACDVYLNADLMPANLSGLEVEVTPEHADIARREFASMGPFLQQLKEMLEGHQGRPARLDWILGATVASGTAWLLTPWPLKFVGLGIAAGRLHMASRQYAGIVAECAEEVRKFSWRFCGTRESIV